MCRPAPLLLVLVSLTVQARAHEIPNARVDRSTQVTLQPGRLALDYEVSLSELTLTQDLRSLIGALPGGDRREWFDRYGQEVGPLNAKGFLITVAGEPIELRPAGFDLTVEDHPRYVFHFSALIPTQGRLMFQDTNYVTSEGTRRLGVRGRDGIEVSGDSLPSEVEEIPIRPVWQLSDAEERRTRQVSVTYGPKEARTGISPVGPGARGEPSRPSVAPRDRLPALLDRVSGVSFGGLALIAFVLGAAHAVQPGHGKTLVAATVLGERGSWLRGSILAIVTTLTHTGSVLLVAAGLWWSRTLRYGEIHVALAHSAGFVIAAIGLWRLGRHLAGYGEHDESEAERDPVVGRGLIALGVAGGLVPCWDAVGLIVLAAAVGRLALGVRLLVAFGLGMAVVLVLVGWLAARFQHWLLRGERQVQWERRLGILSGFSLSAIGVYFLVR